MMRCKQCAVGLLGACSLDYCRTEREALIEQARQAAEAQGHALTDFTKKDDYPIWQATCIRCEQPAAINLDPPTGESGIYGGAVASVCPSADASEIQAAAEQKKDQDAVWYSELASKEADSA